MFDRLRAVPYQPDLRDDLPRFDFGDESYQSELDFWLASESTEAMKKGTKVWLYLNQADVVVGFGSLGPSNWRYPDKSSGRTFVVVIPAVAVRREFWGKPDNANPDDRYSSQILQHLIDEAEAWPDEPPAVGLFVHPENKAAIKLYSRFHFSPFHHSFTDPTTKVTYLSFVRAIVRSDSEH